MDKRIEQLRGRIGADEAKDLDVLEGVLERTRMAYEEKPAERNLRNWSAARDELERRVEQLWQKYFNAKPAFKNRLEAFRWLKKSGYKVGRQKVYDDADLGVLAVQPDKTVLISDVQDYARKNLEFSKDTDPKEMDPDRRIRLERESDLLAIKIKRQNFEHEREVGKYVLKDDVRTEQAVKLNTLREGFKHLINTTALDLIAAVGGKAERRQVLINMISADADDLFDEFANMDEIGIRISGAGDGHIGEDGHGTDTDEHIGEWT